MRPPVVEGLRPSCYEIPSYQIALMWRRIAAKKTAPVAATN